tara:strand:+ start:34013 stop:36058 length:2046 start_codon:yes stop_codon:yes gene_type:complete
MNKKANTDLNKAYMNNTLVRAWPGYGIISNIRRNTDGSIRQLKLKLEDGSKSPWLDADNESIMISDNKKTYNTEFVPQQYGSFTNISSIDPVIHNAGISANSDIFNPINPTPTTPTPIPEGSGGNGGGGGSAYVPPTGSQTVENTNPGTQEGIDISLRGNNVQSNTFQGDSNELSAMASGAIDATDESFNWPEWTPYAVIGGAIGLGAGAYALNEREEREYNRTKAQARNAFTLFASSIDSKKRTDLLAILEIDFARNGPLWKAFERDLLALNLDRDNWSIGGIDYTSRNFGKKDGFAVLPKVEEIFAYTEDGYVIGAGELQRKVDSKAYVGAKKTGSGRISVIDELGNRLEFQTVQRGEFIDSLGNTPEGILNKTKFIERKSTADSDEVALSKARLNDIRRELSRTTVSSTKTPTELIEEFDRKEAFKKRQQKADEEAKERRIKRQQEREAKEAMDLLKKQETLAQANQRLGRVVIDGQVSETRHRLDKNWVDQYVRSGFGGTVPSDVIKSHRYVFNPNGSTLEIEWTDDYSENVLKKPAGFNKETWTRNALINLRAVPIAYGIGGSPLFSQNGSPSSIQPAWVNNTLFDSSSASVIATGTPRLTGFGRSKSSSIRANKIRNYYRRIGGDRFNGSKRSIPKDHAVIIANRARSKGMKARVIPSSKGYRVYVGPQRKRGNL